MRKIIIAVVALLLLAGGGAGAYFYFNQKAEASAGDEASKEHDAAKEDKKAEGGHGGGGGHGEGGGIEYVKMDPLLLPIVNNEGLTQVVSLVVALEVSDAAKKDEVTKLMPRITDAFIQEMYGALSHQGAMKNGMVQVNMIKERLKKIVEKAAGKDMVDDVLLQVVQQRPA